MAVSLLIAIASILVAVPRAEAHPYHLMVSNEALANPEPVDFNSWLAQAFDAPQNFFVSRVALFVRDDPPTGDPLYVSVRADASGVPSATNLTQGSARANGTGSWVDFDLSPWVELAAGQSYWIVIRSLGPDNGGSSYWNSGVDIFGRGFGSSDGISWAAKLTNYNYRVYGFIQPSWSFSASESRASLSAGQTVVFRANFTNGGPGNADALWVNVSLPPQLAYVSDDAGSIGGIRTGSSFTFATIVPGSYSFNVTASAVGGTPDGTVVTTTITFNGTDHNGAPLASTSRSLPVTILAPRLSLSLTANTSSVDPGDSILLNSTVVNVGAVPALSVLMEGTVDPNATFVSASGFASYNPATRKVSGTISSIGVGAQASLEWTVQVPPGTPDLSAVESDATAMCRDGTGTALPPETASTIGRVRVPGFSPALFVDRAFAERGDEVATTFYFNNTGSSASLRAAANWTTGGNYVLVALSPITPFTPAANGFDIAWTNVSVGSHALVARLRVVRGLADGLSLPIQVRWAATDGNGNSLPPATLSRSVTLRAPAPAVSLAPASLRADSGSIFLVSLTVRNDGGAAAIGWLNLTLQPGLEFVDDNGTFVTSVVGSRVSWTVPLLSVGSITTLGVRLRAASAGGSASIRFTFNYTDGKGSPADSIASNAVAVEIVPLGSATFYLLIGIAAIAAAAGFSAFVFWRRRGGKLIIDDAFVVDKGGLLLAHRSASFIQYQDEDILVGMFKAVQDFVKDSFSRGTDEQMKGLDFGDRKILIERGRTHFIAVVYRGPESVVLRERVRKLSQLIDDRFGDILANWNGSMEAVREITLVLPIVWGRAS